MTPLDQLRLRFVGLGEDLQYAIGFALVPALVDMGQRTRSEQDFIKRLKAWLAWSRFTPRAVGDMVSATAFIDGASGEVFSVNATAGFIGSQPAQGKHIDHLEAAMTRTVEQASALIEQSRREVERSRVLLKGEQGRAGDARASV